MFFIGKRGSKSRQWWANAGNWWFFGGKKAGKGWNETDFIEK
jgi:hypothetical protein